MRIKILFATFLLIGILANAQGRRKNQSAISGQYGYILDKDDLKGGFMVKGGYGRVFGDAGILGKAEGFYQKYDVKYLDGRPSKHVTTTNRFLISGYAGADGVKTGFTNAAGDCLVAAATRNGHTLVLALFNDDDRWEDAPAILDYGFRRLQTGK